RQSLENNSDVGINYVLMPVNRDYQLGLSSYNDDALAVGGGFDVGLRSGWLFSLLLGYEQGRNSATNGSIGLRLSYGQAAGTSPEAADQAALQEVEGQACRRRGCGRGR
ncbi:MAG TPA: hypothetical protein VIT90_07830, partial [Lysobacter sp.]